MTDREMLKIVFSHTNYEIIEKRQGKLMEVIMDGCATVGFYFDDEEKLAEVW